MNSRCHLLPVHDGFVCESEGCGHLCMSVKRMRTHWLDVHGRSGLALLDWQPAKLQTFFRGNLLRYFTAPKSRPTEGLKAAHCDLKSSPKSWNEQGILCPGLLTCNCLRDSSRMLQKFRIYPPHTSSNPHSTAHSAPPKLISSPTTSLQPLTASQPPPPEASGSPTSHK